MWKHTARQDCKGIYQKTGALHFVPAMRGGAILTEINRKQSNSENERIFLSKMWSGKGDFSTLLEKERGFKETSYSMCVLVQPGVFFAELPGMMGGEDGFLDRFVYMAVRAQKQFSKTKSFAWEKIQERYADDIIPEMMLQIYRFHKANKVTYQLDEYASALFDTSHDIMVQEFNEGNKSETGILLIICTHFSIA